MAHRSLRFKNRYLRPVLWSLVPFFLYFAQPTVTTLATGSLVMIGGLFIRSWAAGVIEKQNGLTTSGAYAHTRNPLYLGSLFLAVGAGISSSHFLFLLVLILGFAFVYRPLMRTEARRLEAQFGMSYRRFSEQVPPFWPQLTAYPSALSDTQRGFSWKRWRKSREYEAILGAFGLLVALAAKIWLFTFP